MTGDANCPPKETPIENGVTLQPPFYLVVSEHGCWKCRKITPVATLAATSIDESSDELWNEDEEDEEGDELYVLSNIVTLPDRLLAIIQEYCPGYRYTYSRTAMVSYFMNHCLRCDAPLGDFYMHDEPGAAFLPETEEECRRLVLVELPSKKPCAINASYTIRSDGAFVFRHATRKAYRP